jgi:hypothetical protein
MTDDLNSHASLDTALEHAAHESPEVTQPIAVTNNKPETNPFAEMAKGKIGGLEKPVDI